MRRILISGFFVLSLLSITVSLALATSPHFVSARDSVNSDGALVITWREAGLGNNVTVEYTASADATAVWGCVNRGGNHPNASNKETVAGPVSGGGIFDSGRNGTINGSLTVGPLLAPGTLSCPGKMRLVLVSVTYTNVTLTDTTNDLSVTFPDVTRVFFS